MGLKSSFLAAMLAVLCLVPRAANADTITLTGASGGSTDGEDVFPYLFTIVTANNISTNVMMSCLNFDRDVSFNETWTVNEVSVPDIGGTLDGETQADFRADAWLFNLYNTSAGTNSEIQFAIWSIMDPTGVSSMSGFDSTARSLAASAINAASTMPVGNFATDAVYIPDASDSAAWTYGQPQIFMVDPPVPSRTPEPASLFLLGSGMMLLVGILSLTRRAKKTPVSNEEPTEITL
jgi:hypothetical protein